MVKFLRQDKTVIKIESSPFIIMMRYRQLERKDREAGGILLGRMIENSSDVIIDEITVPMDCTPAVRQSGLEQSARVYGC